MRKEVLSEKDIDKKFSELLTAIRKHGRKIDVETIKAAFEFAKVAHADQKRLSGIPVIAHPVQTALILSSWKMDQSTIVAGLLHDTIEHGAATSRDVQNAFGEEVLFLVEGITKTSGLKLKGSNKEMFVENLRKMFLAIAKDLRIVFLRLAERIDNLKSLQFLPKDERKRYAKESLEIFSPLAERLGMWEVKNEIDDLAFKHVFPMTYKKVRNLSRTAYEDAEERIEKMSKQVLYQLKREKVKNAKIYGRKKSFYSLYNKLKRPDIDWKIENVHDVVAMRVLVNNIPECYVALGVVHNLFKPVPHLPLSDFIAVPKPNGYKSIHTKVYGPEEKIVEVQIRTFEMHDQAEHGAAAHWVYSEGKSGKVKAEELEKGIIVDNHRLEWVQQLAKWQKDVKDNQEFLEAVKFDALSRRIFVFSPKGDVFDLPVNATVIDFVYLVHTDLGKFVKGVKVNGKIVPLNYKLKNGEVVEVLKSKNPIKPNDDWLDFVVTTLAKREIKKRLRKNKTN